MPSFFKDLRKRSSYTFRTGKSVSNISHASNGDASSSQSTTTLSISNGSNTPPTALSSDDSSASLRNPLDGSPPITPVPARNVSTKRYSLNGMHLTTPNGSSHAASQTSLLAPRVFSISDNSWVHQKILLIRGQIGELIHKPMDGTVTIHHHQESFPPVAWPVYDSYFKALIHLQPGPNRLRLDFVSQKASTGNGNPTPHSSWININLLPLNSSPPLQLAIILAQDSPETFDAVPERVQREGNNLEIAIRKFRMAAYLWQSFTGEQMNRHGFGRRCFRFEEEWQSGSLTCHDLETEQMRSEARVHIIRSNKTMKEIQDLEISQQHDKASRKDDLLGIAVDAINTYFNSTPGRPIYIACMFLDTHWDPDIGVIKGHAALGGGVGAVQLAIFGSHALQSYPSTLEEVVPAFSDCTKTDTKYVANSCNESGSSWEAANIGIGAHLYEVGRLFGCSPQESGIMHRDYVHLNRTFICREAHRTSTNSLGKRLCLEEDECEWHRLDCLRFRFHPCFRLPTDAPPTADTGLHIWAVENGSVLLTAASGVAWIELFTDDDKVCRSYIELKDTNNGPNYPRMVSISESKLRDRLTEQTRNKTLRISVHSAANGLQTVDDFSVLASAKGLKVKLPDGRHGYRSSKLGLSKLDQSQSQDLIFESAHIQTKLLTCIRVYHNTAINGLEFLYEDKTSQPFGRCSDSTCSTEFSLDTRRGEHIIGFYVRAGSLIDGIQILTSLGRKSEIYGNVKGGRGHTIIPPRGYSIAGVSGTYGQWLDGFALIITR